MNAARCARDMRGWYITGREVMLYLDPDTGKQLHRWRNPWTNGEVSVVHVANDPVQFRLSGAPRSKTHGGVIYFHIDVPLFYPSPLARSPVAADHPTMYQAGEFFSLSAETKDVFDTRRATVRAMNLTWHRVGPWLPWMGMGRRPGLLVYSARGHRVSSRDALPAELKAALDRLPGYDRAPTCYLARPNATSWTYFAAHHAAHARGVRFPVKARAKMGPCKQP